MLVSHVSLLQFGSQFVWSSRKYSRSCFGLHRTHLTHSTHFALLCCCNFKNKRNKAIVKVKQIVKDDTSKLHPLIATWHENILRYYNEAWRFKSNADNVRKSNSALLTEAIRVIARQYNMIHMLIWYASLQTWCQD
jgi:hypothetical protein